MLGDRLKQARKARGMTRQELATATGIPYSTIAEIEQNEQRSSTRAHRLAHALQVRLEWLVEGKGQMDLEQEPESEDWANILAFLQPASLGPGAEIDEYAETHKLKFRRSSLIGQRLKPQNLAVVYGRGDSMEPRIKSGDAILFDRGDREPKDGALYVVTYDRKLMAKQLSELGGRWFIESLNKNSRDWKKPVPIDEHKGFEIHGRVRWIGSWER